jgi:hypothetical protein
MHHTRTHVHKHKQADRKRKTGRDGGAGEASGQRTYVIPLDKVGLSRASNLENDLKHPALGVALVDSMDEESAAAR